MDAYQHLKREEHQRGVEGSLASVSCRSLLHLHRITTATRQGCPQQRCLREWTGYISPYSAVFSLFPVALVRESAKSSLRVYFGSWFKITVHYGMRVTAAGDGSSGTHGIHSQEADNNESCLQRPFFVLCAQRPQPCEL